MFCTSLHETKNRSKNPVNFNWYLFQNVYWELHHSRILNGINTENASLSEKSYKNFFGWTLTEQQLRLVPQLPRDAWKIPFVSCPVY